MSKLILHNDGCTVDELNKLIKQGWIKNVSLKFEDDVSEIPITLANPTLERFNVVYDIISKVKLDYFKISSSDIQIKFEYVDNVKYEIENFAISNTDEVGIIVKELIR